MIETIGSIENFINAVKKVDGLEWLGEFEVDDIDPEYGFEDAKDPEKKLKGRLFLIMTDQRALQELQNLFTNWQQDNTISFPRGLAPLKQAFAHLHTIRPWDAEDRIRDTGIIEDWKDRIEHGQQIVPFEAELWFRNSPGRQQQAQRYLSDVVDALGGEIVQQCVIPQITYHGVLGKIPIDEFSALLAEMARLRTFRLLQCEDIMHIRPVGQCAIRVSDYLSETGTAESEAPTALSQEGPLVAMFDGLPLTGHRLLDGRLIVDDPDDYESAYQAKERLHGTAMASLICHGDVNENAEPLTRPLYVRPIMQPRRGFDGQFVEAIPDDVLPVDLVHRAVRRLYESEGDEPPVAPSVRVINLSVCDRYRPFDRGMSAWARLLDWLAWKYNVLFVVSAGNHTQDIQLNLRRADFQNLAAEERERRVIEAIAADTRHRRLLAPAEALNSITLAATHADASPATANPHLIDPFAQNGLPSTTSAHGPGYQRAIKPDIFLPGGRQLLSEKLGTTHPNAILQTTFFNRAPGQCVASPGPAGELDRTIHTRGTSNAAALASRWANVLFDLIQQLRSQPGTNLPAEYDVVLLKTLLVHGADWANAGALYTSILKNDQNSRTFKDYVGRLLGYGSADVAKVMVCTDQRATVLGAGTLDNEEGHEFFLPLPPSLSAVTEKRRLTITLAWISPVNSRHHSYRTAHLWFNPKNDLAPSRMDADHRAVQRGTVQHEVLEGAKAVDYQDGDTIAIKVSCRADAGDIPEPIRYGLAVTLEVADGIDIPIYQEVRDRLRVPVPVQSGGRV
ncbi:MAG: S8 family peptidase [Desulfosarcina sp.]|nr:S8 family peptidase [Desulfosarcina sp.]